MRILLLGLSRNQRELLAQHILAAKADAQLLPAAGPADALASLDAQQADAIVCDWLVLPALAQALAGVSLQSLPVPVLVLVPPEAEEAGAALLESDSADFVLEAGNYPVWVLACLRRALQRQEAPREEVARILRHELNNPLTGVLGNAELILAEGGALPESVRRRARTIIELAVRLRDVVQSLEERLRRREGLRPDQVANNRPAPSSVGHEVTR